MWSEILGILGTVSEFIQKLFELKLVVYRGAKVYYKESEIEFVYHIHKPSDQSKLSSLIISLQSLLVSPQKISNVVQAYGYGLQSSENLMDMGVLKLEGKSAIIDLSRLLKDVKSELIVLSFRTSLPKELLNRLLARHIEQNSRHVDGTVVAYFSLSLDEAGLWAKDFEDFTVENIEFTFNIEIQRESIEPLIPQEFAKKILKAGKVLYAGKKEAIRFFDVMTRVFLTFESPEIVDRLKKSVTVEPLESVEVVFVNPRMKSYRLGDLGHSIILPGSFSTLIRCRLSSKDITLKGSVTIDLAVERSIMKELIRKVEQETKSIKL